MLVSWVILKPHGGEQFVINLSKPKGDKDPWKIKHYMSQ